MPDSVYNSSRKSNDNGDAPNHPMGQTEMSDGQVEAFKSLSVSTWRSSFLIKRRTFLVADLDQTWDFSKSLLEVWIKRCQMCILVFLYKGLVSSLMNNGTEIAKRVFCLFFLLVSLTTLYEDVSSFFLMLYPFSSFIFPLHYLFYVYLLTFFGKILIWWTFSFVWCCIFSSSMMLCYLHSLKC